MGQLHRPRLTHCGTGRLNTSHATTCKFSMQVHMSGNFSCIVKVWAFVWHVNVKCNVLCTFSIFFFFEIFHNWRHLFNMGFDCRWVVLGWKRVSCDWLKASYSSAFLWRISFTFVLVFFLHVSMKLVPLRRCGQNYFATPHWQWAGIVMTLQLW